jgi:hypothetical protein
MNTIKIYFDTGELKYLRYFNKEKDGTVISKHMLVNKVNVGWVSKL